MTTADTPSDAMPSAGVALSPLAMAVLLLLAHEPMHPYGLRQRVRDWDKDRVINVSQRNAIYYTVDRLRAAGLIALRETERQDNRPDRSVYEVTELGNEQAAHCLRNLLATPAHEYPKFPAALAFIQSLSAADTIDALQERIGALNTKIASLDKHVASRVATVPGGVDRIYLVEVEYQQEMWRAELHWVERLLEDIREGRAWQGAPG